MPTHGLSLNKPVVVPPLIKIVSALISNFLWHATAKFGTCVCKEKQSWERDWKYRPNVHRKETIRFSRAFIRAHSLPAVFEAILEESIFSLYVAYSQIMQWKVIYDQNNEIELVGVNKFHPPVYFSVYGEFDDVAWSKRVVLDPKYPLFTRFYIACCYWFEDESAVLWSELKNSSSVHSGDDQVYLYDGSEPIVWLRISHLESNLELDQQFYEDGFRVAAAAAHVHATYYFWQKLSESEKDNIVGTDRFFKLLSGFQHYPDDKVSCFLYSQLTKEQKEKFLHWTVRIDTYLQWVTLLLSPYSEAFRSEIYELVYQLPMNLFGRIFDFIRRVMKDTHQKEVFRVLWTNIPPDKKEKILEERPYFNEYHVVNSW